MVIVFINILVTLLSSKVASAQVTPMVAKLVSGVTHQWKNIGFGQSITTPIIVASPLSYAGPQPASVRVRNVTATGFAVRVQEWDSQDGLHAAEKLSYVAMRRGRYLLKNGAVVVADSVRVTGGGFQSKTFRQPFNTTPVILATVVTQNENSAVAVQIRNVTTRGFQIRLREQEANVQVHAAETLHFIAWEPGRGAVNGLRYTVGRLGVKDQFTTLWFAAPFASIPTFIAGAQTTLGADTFSIRYRNLTRARVEKRLQEDDSLDAESSHVTETVGYLLLGSAGPPGAGQDANFVAMGDSITSGIGDDITSDNFSDGTLPAGGHPPILTNLYASKSGQRVLIANEGIPGDRSADGLNDINNLIRAYPLATYFLLLYGANDVNFNIPSGAGLFPGQPGYLGSFKANMQNMINAIHNAGKTAVLAKVLYQTSPTKDALIQQYNQVINELVAQNGILVEPPNFYDFFRTHPGQFRDGLHPNGIGYQSMAQLWHSALTPIFP